MSGSISVFRSKFYIIFIPLPAPLLFMGLLNLSCIFMYEISSPLSQIMTQNLFPVWPVSISLLPQVHKSSFIHKLSYQIFSLATGSNFHRFHPCHPQWSTDFPTFRPYIISLFYVYSNPHYHNFFLVFPLPIQIFLFVFQNYQQFVNTAFLKTEMQRIPSLSDHEAAELHNCNTESLDGLAFFPINSWPADIRNLFHKSEPSDISTFKFIVFAFDSNISPHLFLNFLLIKYRKNPGKIPKRILPIQLIMHSIPEKKH